MNTFGVDYVPSNSTSSLSKDGHAKETKTEKAKENYNVKQSKIAIGSGGLW
jgi:hypothetical protein